MTALHAAGITDPGQVRAQNQDTFYVADDLVLIADGMGGYAGGEVVVTDLGSTNGTFVNGRKVTRAEVQPGDELSIGTSRLRVEVR